MFTVVRVVCVMTVSQDFHLLCRFSVADKRVYLTGNFNCYTMLLACKQLLASSIADDESSLLWYTCVRANSDKTPTNSIADDTNAHSKLHSPERSKDDTFAFSTHSHVAHIARHREQKHIRRRMSNTSFLRYRTTIDSTQRRVTVVVVVVLVCRLQLQTERALLNYIRQA